MQINQIDNSYNTNFKISYEVRKVVIDGVEHSRKDKTAASSIAKVLADRMYNGTLTKEEKRLVQQYFPDFYEKMHNHKMFPKFYAKPSVVVARTPGKESVKRIDILACDDALEYKGIFVSNRKKKNRCVFEADFSRENQDLGYDVLRNIMERNGHRQIIISAKTDVTQDKGMVITKITEYIKQET